ncbi:two-component system phosphate regulon sensor histidine kinase PhoR [Hymenobacter luteus]|uniref:histidine kinase n=2 Tax=Hymenobacter TaxID=89966 RepID=A0A7W9SXC0_9BACT|nr:MULTISPECIES: HAMP domain-containing sensor histidine kinase [Hymenobacter]MBB4600095.1 two-component system phosphate regulon sensor histidine kinase PhoR [Hymenobacter latericoloratus]MBB6057595.1 two-component system phosphate regulon sensor histidine kinase PhoR [Hymenobacter luteus]
MRFTVSSRVIAIILSLLVAAVLTALAWVAPTLSLREGVLAAGITVAACFLLLYLMFEALIFREINNIYEGLEHIKRKELRRMSNKFLFRPEPLKRMRDEILDMAQRKQQEIDELKRLQVLRREFLADVSHELKTPIFAAQGFVHTILDDDDTDEFTRKKFLQKAAASLDALDLLVQDLVTISQLEKGVVRMRRQPFDIARLVLDIFEQLELKASRRRVTLELAPVPGNSAWVVADRNRIRQVLINLIDNAIKYGRENGHVTVALAESGKALRISVQDDGEGIPKQHQSRIFERFYRIDKSRTRESREAGGSGLGLAISKHIVEAHKSTIRVRSEVGQGTTLEFKLPRPRAAAVAPATDAT